jgi:hypothetical protein
MTRHVTWLLFLLSCGAPTPELARDQKCPACVCERAPACPAPAKDYCHDWGMAEYQEGVQHGKYFQIQAIVMDMCFDFAGEGPGWEARFDQCIAGFRDWEENFPGQSDRW